MINIVFYLLVVLRLDLKLGTMNDKESNMNTKEILASLERSTGKFPEKALRAAIENKDEIIPDLLRFITYAKEHAEDISKQKTNYFIGHMYALYLLAQFRETSAYGPIIDLFGTMQEEIIHDITGDIITEDLHRILASVYGGDDRLIKKLIENKKAPPYVRAAAIESFVTMVNTGLETRENVIDYYAQLYRGKLERKFSFPWNILVSCTTDLNPGELFEEIEKAYNEGLFETGFISMDEIEREKKWSIEESMELIIKRGNYSLINDTIAEMNWWACFRDSPGKYEDNNEYNKSGADNKFKPIRTTPKTGRNEPCPCGSGKKFKKCCGKQG